VTPEDLIVPVWVDFMNGFAAVCVFGALLIGFFSGGGR
jgi:hypothetical protein